MMYLAVKSQMTQTVVDNVLNFVRVDWNNHKKRIIVLVKTPVTKYM